MQQLAFAGTTSLGQSARSIQRVRSARSKNRASAWSHDLAKWHAYKLSQTTNPEHIARLDAEYEQLRAQGPDFSAYHTGSVFAEAPVHDLTREDRIKILTAFDGLRSALYRHCREPHGQAVSQTYKSVLRFLLGLAVKHQRAFPSLNTIAAATLCSKSTVLRAISWLRLYGFLDRIRRIVRTPSALGPRVRQTSNAYALQFPKRLSALAANVFGRGPECHKTTPSRSDSEVKKAMRGSGFVFEAPPPLKPQPAVHPRQEATQNWRDRARVAIGTWPKAPHEEKI